MAVLGGGAVSYERGTPVGLRDEEGERTQFPLHAKSPGTNGPCLLLFMMDNFGLRVPGCKFRDSGLEMGGRRVMRRGGDAFFNEVEAHSAVRDNRLRALEGGGSLS